MTLKECRSARGAHPADPRGRVPRAHPPPGRPAIVEEAERSSNDSRRLEAYKKLSDIISWLNVIP